MNKYETDTYHIEYFDNKHESVATEFGFGGYFKALDVAKKKKAEYEYSGFAIMRVIHNSCDDRWGKKSV